MAARRETKAVAARAEIDLSKIGRISDTIDHVYLNVCMPVGRTIIATSSAIEAKYTETRSEPVLMDPTQWHMSIVRFNVPTSLIPICFMGVQGTGITFTGIVTLASPTITFVSNFYGLSVGQTLFGQGIPTTPPTTIIAINTTLATITMSVVSTFSSIVPETISMIQDNVNLLNYSVSLQATPASPVRQVYLVWTPESTAVAAPILPIEPISGFLTTGSFVITGVDEPTLLLVGQTISGNGIPPATTIVAINPAAETVTMSAAATTTTNPSGPPTTFASAPPAVPNPLTDAAMHKRFNTQNLQYYSLFSYQHFIDIINTAWASAFALASADVGWPPAATFPPFMTFDSVTGQVSLSAQTAYDSGVAVPIGAYMNGELMEFFQGTFQVIFNGFQGLPPTLPGALPGSDYKLVIKNNGFNTLANIPNPTAVAQAGFQMKQEFASLILWTDLAAITFQTGLIPVNPEYSPAVTTSTVEAGGVPIVTDFQPATSGSGTDLRSFITYVPASEYRLSDLLATSPMSKLDLQVLWSDNFGNSFPIFVTHNDCISAKIMFRKRDFGHMYSTPRLDQPSAMGGCIKCASGGCDSCGGSRSVSRRR